MAFVVFLQSIRDLETPPEVHLVPSTALQTFLSRSKVEVVAVDSLARDLKLPNIWDQIVSESAA